MSDIGKAACGAMVSLDGVVQAPGRPDEDMRGGFRHGGWSAPYFDETAAQVADQGMSGEGALLLGRRTYEQFYEFWPNQPDSPFTESLTNQRKYVVSNTLAEPLPWANSVLLPGDAIAAVRELKAGDGPDLTLMGSGELFRALYGAGLVDTLQLSIHPLTLGGGQVMFMPQAALARLRLVSSVPTSTGVIVARYDVERLEV